MTITAPPGRRPYRKTRITVAQSKAQISELLRAYGAEGMSWVDNFQTGAVQLRFALREGDRTTMYQITPAAFRETHRAWDEVAGRSGVRELANWPRAMRLLHDWLKTKLDAAAFGLVSVEEEFLAQQIVRDRDGNETTVGELVLPAISGGRLSLPPPRNRDAMDAESRPA